MGNKTYTRQSLADLTATMPEASARLFQAVLSRRAMIGGTAGLAAAAVAAPAVFAQDATPGSEPTSNVWTPPEGAAPVEDQIWRVVSPVGMAKTVDFYERVYERPSAADLFSISLVGLSKEFEIVPMAATEWSSNDDGTVWTFTLRDDLMWSDGNPVTAADYVRTFQYAADPEHAWDFAWFWSDDILNFTEAVAGEVPLEEVGVAQGANEYEVVFTTVNPAPYLPAKLLYSQPLSAAALDTHGPLYNSNPDTATSSGPFILTEWVPDQLITLERNEAYSGPWQVPMQKIINKFADPAQSFTLYEAGEIDFMEGPAPAELTIMQADRPDEIFQGVGDFACLYFFFDVTTAPFDNKLVRQAFSHVIDRDAMAAQIWGPQAKPAYSFLAPGFPAANGDELASIQAFDPELGKQLLAEAGYPDGEGFPTLVMTVRGNGSPLETATTQAYGTMITEYLNIPVELQTMDRQTFYADMASIQFGWVSYGMDFFDASNMLGIWKTGGRHPWSNADFDALVDEAASFLGDEAERNGMFQEAERILVEDVPAVWAYFLTPNQLIKSYVTGPALEADSNGIAAIHWPGMAVNGSALYEIWMSSDAPAGRS